MKYDDINTTVKEYYDLVDPTHRYSSFDYCYNYFKGNSKEYIVNDMEKSCAVLGFYLASWGMLPESSFLIDKSYKYYIPLISYLASMDKGIWEVTPDNYGHKETQDMIMEIYNKIKELIIEKNNQDRILVTTIMLGAIGIVPAYDANFCKMFRTIMPINSKFAVFNRKSLEVLGCFYKENRIAIDELSKGIKTYNFSDGNEVYNYPLAKIIYMYGFLKGLRI